MFKISDKAASQIETFCCNGFITEVLFNCSSLQIKNERNATLCVDFSETDSVSSWHRINNPALFLSALLMEKTFKFSKEKISIGDNATFDCDMRSEESGEEQLVPICEISKDDFGKNLGHRFELTASNCWANEKMVGTVFNATSGKLNCSATGIIGSEQFTLEGAVLNQDSFFSHDSPINFNRACGVFRKEYFDTIMSFDFKKLELYLPIYNSNGYQRIKVILFFEDGSALTFYFTEVYQPKDRIENKHRLLLEKAATENYKIEKADIEKILQKFVKVRDASEDENVCFEINKDKLKLSIGSSSNGFLMNLYLIDYLFRTSPSDDLLVKVVQDDEDEKKFLRLEYVGRKIITVCKQTS